MIENDYLNTKSHRSTIAYAFEHQAGVSKDIITTADKALAGLWWPRSPGEIQVKALNVCIDCNLY